jgi:uncharacterized protein (TIGR02099 family)
MHAPLTPARRRWRRLRLALKGAFATVVIGMAVVLAAAATAVPWIVDHPGRVRDFLSERLARPVDFDALRGQWTRSGPVFALSGLSIGDPGGGEPFRIGEAELAIDFYAWLRRGVSFSEFRLVGLDIDAERLADGRWRVARLAATGPAINLDALLDLTGVGIRGAKVRVRDPARGLAFTLARVDLRVSNDFGARRFGGVAWLEEDLAPLRFACAARRAGNDCWLGGRGIDAARWLRALPLAGVQPVRGVLDADLWLTFDARLERLRVEARATDLVLRGVSPVPFSSGLEIEPRESLPFLRVAARFERDGEAWRADWLDWREDTATPSTRASVRQAGPAAPVELRAPRIDLAAAAPLLALSDALPPGLRRLLYENAPTGALLAVGLDFDGANATGALRMEKVRLAVGSRTPGVDSLSGTLRADGGFWRIEPDPGLAVTIDYPHVFRQALELTVLGGEIGVWRADDGTRVEASELRFEGDGYAGELRAQLHFDGVGSRPTLDAVLAVDRGEVPKARLFWPVNVLKAPTIAWLDRALVAGRVEQGAAVVHGDLDGWPFRGGAGRFLAQASVRDADLDYHPRWPAARIDRAELVFDELGMVADTDAATLMGNRVSLAHMEIDSFKDPLMELHVEGESAGNDLLALLRASPVLDATGGYLTQIDVGGRAEVALDLVLPLKPGVGEQRLFGTARLHDADLADRQYRLDFAQANGRMRFSNRGFAADDLAVRIAGDPAELSIATGEFAANPEHAIEASLRGELPLSTVLAGVPAATPLLALAPGRSQWAVELAVDRDPTASIGPARRVTLRSDLVGMALDLPAPLRKDAASALPVRVQVGLPVIGAPLEIEIGQLLRARARLPTLERPFSAYVAMGVAEAGAPPASGLRVRGDAAALDFGGWAALGAAGPGAGGSLDVYVSATELLALGRVFADTRVRARPVDGALEVAFDGVGVLGSLSLSARKPEGLSATFERLHLPEATPGVAGRAIDPATLPALHLWVKDLKLGDAQLGEARIETFPIAGGLRVERLETSSPVIAIRARGDWTLVQAIERSRFDITFTAEDLGRMLDALGFAGIVDGGQTIVQIDGEWSGSPAQFGLPRIAGTLHAKVGQGRILDVDPGAGRLLGLVSLQAIPRRLSLDFSDFFRSGMSFDAIEGRFELRRGDAFTTDLVVRGPSADIAVTGRTGLSARDYDQELQVTPKVGGVLPVVGALAAGPVGIAAGLVAQGVLKSPIDQMARARYRVTGSWEKPKIDLVARDRGRRAPQPAGRDG